MVQVKAFEARCREKRLTVEAWPKVGPRDRLHRIGTVQLCDAKADIGRNSVPGSEVGGTLGDRGARSRGAVAEHTWRHRLEEPLTVALQ